LTKLFVALITALLVLLVTQESILKLGVIQRLELATIDYRFQHRGLKESLRDSGVVVIVEISQDSYRALPDRFPWPRSYYAHLIRNLKRAGAKVVGLDLMLTGADMANPENDQDLRDAIRESGMVVLAGKIEPENDQFQHVSSNENFGNEFLHIDSTLGIVNILNDADGVHRRYTPFFESAGNYTVPTFALAVLNKYFGLSPFTTAEDWGDRFAYAGRDIPKYDASSFLINFYGSSGTSRFIKFADVIDDSGFATLDEIDYGTQLNTFDDPIDGYLYDRTFKNKIVLVGSRVPEDHDLFPVSIAKGRRQGDNLMYGVEIHANVIESILRSDFVRKQSVALEILSVLFFCFVTFFVTSALKASKTRFHFLVEVNGFLFALAEIFVLAYASLLLFTHASYLLTTISPILAVLSGYFASTTYHFVVERKQRVLIKEMFSTYVNPSVVDELISNPEKLALGGERRTLTVLFADIEGFTTISENLPSEQLVGILNEYLSAMSEVVFRHSGTLDKYQGDAIMAFWGAPIAQADHALNACRAAIEMQQVAKEIRAAWRSENKPLFHLRIGVNTGEMVVGNMGAMRKFDYTVIGDSVNLGSRLEGANKQYHTGIIVSENTFSLVRQEMIGRELDLLTVKGRSEPIHIYELLMTRESPLDHELREFLIFFGEGIEQFRKMRWEEARASFSAASSLRPEDNPTLMYLQRISQFEIDPPPKNWDGVFEMTTK